MDNVLSAALAAGADLQAYQAQIGDLKSERASIGMLVNPSCQNEPFVNISRMSIVTLFPEAVGQRMHDRTRQPYRRLVVADAWLERISPKGNDLRSTLTVEGVRDWDPDLDYRDDVSMYSRVLSPKRHPKLTKLADDMKASVLNVDAAQLTSFTGFDFYVRVDTPNMRSRPNNQGALELAVYKALQDGVDLGVEIPSGIREQMPFIDEEHARGAIPNDLLCELLRALLSHGTVSYRAMKFLPVQWVETLYRDDLVVVKNTMSKIQTIGFDTQRQLRLTSEVIRMNLTKTPSQEVKKAPPKHPAQGKHTKPNKPSTPAKSRQGHPN